MGTPKNLGHNAMVTGLPRYARHYKSSIASDRDTRLVALHNRYKWTLERDLANGANDAEGGDVR